MLNYKQYIFHNFQLFNIKRGLGEDAAKFEHEKKLKMSHKTHEQWETAILCPSLTLHQPINCFHHATPIESSQRLCHFLEISLCPLNLQREKKKKRINYDIIILAAVTNVTWLKKVKQKMEIVKSLTMNAETWNLVAIVIRMLKGSFNGVYCSIWEMYGDRNSRKQRIRTFDGGVRFMWVKLFAPKV